MFRRCAAGKQRQPVIQPGEQRKHHAAEQHVMQMRHHEMRVMHLPVKWHHRDHHTGQAAQHEDEQEPEDEQQRCFQHRLAGKQRRDPYEYLDAGRNGDRHAGRRKKRQRQQRNADREHVMHPQPETDEAGGNHGQHQP